MGPYVLGDLFPQLGLDSLDMSTLPLTLSTIATLPGVCRNMSDFCFLLVTLSELCSVGWCPG